MKGIEIKHAYDALWSAQTAVMGTWDVISKLIVPFRGDFWREVTNENSINWHQNREIFDSTAPNSNNLLASSIHSALTNPAYQWFDIVFRNPSLRKMARVRQWSQETTLRVYNALMDSNFDLEANELYLDLPSYGTGIILEEEVLERGSFKELLFQSVPLKEGLFEEDARGQVLRFYRKYKYTAHQIRDKFGVKNIPLVVSEQFDTVRGATEKIDVIFCIYPRQNKLKNKNSPKRLSAKQRPFGFKYVLYNAPEEMLGEEGGYYEMPSYVPRWRKTNQSKYGNSPGMIALPDILTINQLTELVLTATEKVVDPATLVTERGLMSNLDLNPAGMTIVRDIEKSLKAYESRARFDVSSLQRENLISSIRNIFYVDQLEMKESPAMTATEVNVRYELMQRLLGPTFGRLKSDFLDRMVERTFYILYRNGEIDPIPEEAYTGDGNLDLDIVYTGPMARAQRMDKVNAAFQWVGQLAEIAALHPSLEPVLDIINVEEFGRITAADSSVDAAMVEDLKSMRKKAAARAEAQATAQAAAKGEALQELGKGEQEMAAANQEEGNVVPIGNRG